MALKEGLTVLAAWGALGAGVGYAVEQATNDTSRGRVITIDTCLKTTPHENTITQTLLDCMQDGVPNGNKVGPGLKEGQPIEFVNSFRAAQVNEANTADTGNIVLYGLGGMAVGYFIFE